MKFTYILFILLLISIGSNAQNLHLNYEIDSLIISNKQVPFNGTILIAKGNHIIYEKYIGYADLINKDTLNADNTFIIGSISKQITAVLILQEIEKSKLGLNDPISKYIPDLPKSWRDSVTVHHLLTHTHGILETNKNLEFTPGSQFSYSQIGYDLLAKILEKINNKSFADISAGLFKRCNIYNTSHPYLHKDNSLVNCYNIDHQNNITKPEKYEIPVAAGGFISNARDLLTWNKKIFGGELLGNETYKKMISKHANAVRNHPIFGLTYYGYGITVDDTDELIQLGQTGYLPSYISMNFYFPQHKTSVIVLQNTSRGNNLKEKFFYHTHVLDIVKKHLKN